MTASMNRFRKLVSWAGNARNWRQGVFRSRRRTAPFEITAPLFDVLLKADKRTELNHQSGVVDKRRQSFVVIDASQMSRSSLTRRGLVRCTPCPSCADPWSSRGPDAINP